MQPEAAGREPIFKWETLREIGPCPLQYRMPREGKRCEIELTNGQTVQVWRGDDGQTYFCHGLTFGGKAAPGGPISPFSGAAVNILVRDYYDPVVPETAALVGDILVWHGPGGTTPHSAILLELVVEADQSCLGYASKLQTKNGVEPETVMTLEQLIRFYYGESYKVYRRK